LIDGTADPAIEPVRAWPGIQPSATRPVAARDFEPPGWSLQVVQELVSSGRYVITCQTAFDVVLRKTSAGSLPAG
jgi:hypothetical protein